MNFGSAQPGELVTFGSYPQCAEGTDKTPIQWRILEKTGETLFLLSEYLLDCRRYHDKTVDISWRDCDLRRWLNGVFLETAFTAEERGRIRVSLNSDNGLGSPDTEDWVFLLSVPEVEAFTSPKDEGRRRRAIGTGYAKATKADGCRLYVYDMGVEADYLLEDGVRQGCSWWWTRTQSQREMGHLDRATFVGARGNIKRYGKVDLRFYGVRPAVRVRR